MDRTELGRAREYATEHGLEPRGTRVIGVEKYALYAYDAERRSLFYFSTLADLRAHVAANAATMRPTVRAFVRGRRRLGSFA